MRKLAPVLLLLLGAAPAPPTGTITGTVLAIQDGKVVASPYVFAFLQPVKAPLKAPGDGMKFAIHQKDKHFVPNVLVIPRGAVVAFPNDDDTSHNVFSPTEPHFDLGRANGKESRDLKWQFDDDGAFDIYCDIHQEMWAKVLVVDSAYIVPVTGNHYTFANVPPGKYKVAAWAPSSQEVFTNVVAVSDGGTVTANEKHLQLRPIDTAHTRISGAPYEPYPPSR